MRKWLKSSLVIRSELSAIDRVITFAVLHRHNIPGFGAARRGRLEENLEPLRGRDRDFEPGSCCAVEVWRNEWESTGLIP